MVNAMQKKNVKLNTNFASAVKSRALAHPFIMPLMPASSPVIQSYFPSSTKIVYYINFYTTIKQYIDIIDDEATSSQFPFLPWIVGDWTM